MKRSDRFSGSLYNIFSKLSSLNRHPLMTIVLIGFTIRILLGIVATYNYDIYHWGVVIQNIDSGNGLYEMDGYYYTQPWGYILGTISYIGELIGIGDLGERVTEALAVEEYTEWHFTATLATIPFILLIKIPLFLCDLAVAYLIRWIIVARTDSEKKGNIAFALWFLCPLTIVVSGVTAMFDNLMVLMLLLSIVFLMQDRCFLAGSMFCLSVMTKFFPVFLIFVLAAYIMMKHREDGLAYRKLGSAALGVMVIFVIIMMPQILDGNVSDAFSFLTSRATSGVGAGFGAIEKYGTIIVYSALTLISMFLAVRLYRNNATSNDDILMLALLINVIILFIYPSTPQYMLLILPFLIYHIVICDRRIMFPGAILVVGSTVFALAANFTVFLSLSAHGVMDMTSLMEMIDVFQSPIFGLSPMAWMYFAGGILQYIGTLMLLLHLYKERRFDVYRGIHRKGRIDSDGLASDCQD